jgi:hypothetical protein
MSKQINQKRSEKFTPLECLEQIEYKKRTWKSEIMKSNDIWEYIAEMINSTKGKELKYWCEVMDLYHKKYRFKK